MRTSKAVKVFAFVGWAAIAISMVACAFTLRVDRPDAVTYTYPSPAAPSPSATPAK